MNFAGHAIVAARHAGHPDVTLGAIAPDLLPHSGTVPARPLPDPIETGRRLHHATDAVFHRHPTFLAQQRAVHDRLTAEGVARGPARAAAHLGVELLLDGALLAGDEAAVFTSVWARLRQPDAAVRALVTPASEPAWRDWLAGFTGFLEPARYADPGYTASRIERILTRRPRLALPAEQTALLSHALAAVNAEVQASARRIVDDLVTTLGARS